MLGPTRKVHCISQERITLASSSSLSQYRMTWLPVACSAHKKYMLPVPKELLRRCLIARTVWNLDSIPVSSRTSLFVPKICGSVNCCCTTTSSTELKQGVRDPRPRFRLQESAQSMRVDYFGEVKTTMMVHTSKQPLLDSPPSQPSR